MKRLILSVCMALALIVPVVANATPMDDLRNDVDEVAALTELAETGNVTLDALVEYATPYTPEKWTDELCERMIHYFNSLDWYALSDGDPARVAEICQRLLFVVPVTEQTGRFLSIVKAKKSLME